MRNKAPHIVSPSPPTSREGRPPLDRPSLRAPRLIGVGVDGGPSGRDAAVLASLLGRTTGAELMLIAVIDEPLVLLPGPEEGSWKTRQEQARVMLEETRESLAPEARVVVQTGAIPSRALRDVVRRKHRDLLVIGSGHSGTEGQVSLGQSGREFMSSLDRPLAIAPRDMRDRERLRLKRIGVGFGDEPEAMAGFQMATVIARAARAEIEVCGVIDDRVPGRLRTEQIVLGGEAIVGRQAESLSEDAVAAARASGVPARVQVGRGDPSAVLRTLATGVDLLVIGSSRSGPVGRVSLGRVGSAVTEGSPCPVLIVPRPG